MNVKLIRMWSGEDVVADVVEEKENSIVFVNPIVAVATGQGQIHQLNMFLKENRLR